MSKLSAHPGIVVGVDGSPASKVAVQWAARDAELRTVPLTLVHVVRATAGTWLETPLLPATTYSWELSVTDANGNWAQRKATFTTP